jgi:hypothetical protein
MHSYSPIGEDSVSDDKGLFESYWDRVKAFIPELLALPAKIRGLRQEALGYQIVAKQRALTTHANALGASATKLSGMASVADSIKARIQKYLPFWRKQESGLSLPILIPIVALSALAVVAVQGLSLLKDYAAQRAIVEDVKGKFLTLAEAQALTGSMPKPKGGGIFGTLFGEGLEDSMKYIGLGVAGVLAFVLYQRLAKKGVG